MVFDLPFGRGTMPLDTGSYSAELLQSRIDTLAPAGSGADIVAEAIHNPIGSRPLHVLAEGKRRATVIISDHTRPVPSRDILPHMLAELRRGNPGIDITLLVATGCHRSTNESELRAKLGDAVYEQETIVVHDCTDTGALVEIGALPSGARLIVNRHAVDTDLLVAEGFIEPHFFAGYSGGRKSVLPGICGHTTVLGNHCAQFISSPYARAGILDNNPIQRDMEAAVTLANLAFIVNVIIDHHHQTVLAFAGDAIKAHRAGCDKLAEYCRVVPQKKGDIVISTNGGYPLDQNIYQAVKGLTAAEAAAKEDGIIILCAQCADGTGSEDFYRALRDCDSPETLLANILQIPMDETRPDQWEYQILARILTKHRVILVADPSMESIIRDMKMDYAPSVQQAFEGATHVFPDGHAVVIQNGVSVVVGTSASLQ